MPQMPKRVKYRKRQRGVVRGRTTRKKYHGPIKGFAHRGNFVAYGDYGLQTLEGAASLGFANSPNRLQYPMHRKPGSDKFERVTWDFAMERIAKLAKEDRDKNFVTKNRDGVTVNRVGSMFTFFFTDKPVTDYESAKRSDTARFGRFFRLMLERGIYLAPSQFEAAFLSTAHSEEDIDRTLAAARECFSLSAD